MEIQDILENYDKYFNDITKDLLEECRSFNIKKEIYFLEGSKIEEETGFLINYKPQPKEVKLKNKLIIHLTKAKEIATAIYSKIPTEKKKEFLNILLSNTDELIKDISENEKKYFKIKETITDKPDIYSFRIKREIKSEGYAAILINMLEELKTFIHESGNGIVNTGVAEESKETKNADKYRSILNTEQTAYFLRLLSDTGIIPLDKRGEKSKFINSMLNIIEINNLETINKTTFIKRFQYPTYNAIATLYPLITKMFQKVSNDKSNAEK
jgi:hypothetical protein